MLKLDVHVVGEKKEDSNWRQKLKDFDDPDDDELLDKTPQDVVDMLGFDPLEDEE